MKSREKSIAKREKIVKFYKNQLLYYAKLRSNLIGRKIKEKTCNLTKNCAKDSYMINHTFCTSQIR